MGARDGKATTTSGPALSPKRKGVANHSPPFDLGLDRPDDLSQRQSQPTRQPLDATPQFGPQHLGIARDSTHCQRCQKAQKGLYL